MKPSDKIWFVVCITGVQVLMFLLFSNIKAASADLGDSTNSLEVRQTIALEKIARELEQARRKCCD